MSDQTEPKADKGIHEVADDIKTAIAAGQLKPGQRLVETQLSEMFGVKRNRIREALRKMEHEGFVKVTPNVGAVVAEFSRTDIEHIYDLLGTLDGLAVRLATPFVTGEQIEKLELLIAKMESTDEIPLISGLNDELHCLLCALSGNSRLVSLTDNLRLNIKVFGYRSFYVPGQIAASNAEHRKILECMKRNQPIQAEKVTRAHLINSKNRLVKWLYRSL